MAQYTFPAWSGELERKVNATGGEGMPGVVQNFHVFNRAGALVDRDGFLTELGALVARYEAMEVESPLGRMPTDPRKLRAWMERALAEFLGFDVVVPELPKFNRAQFRLMRHLKLRLIFIPDLPDHKLKALAVKPNWGRYLTLGDIERIPLPGKWVAYEVIEKPNYDLAAYPDDQLMAAIGITSRFNHPHSGKGEGDDLVENILPKVAAVLAPLGGQVMVQSAEEFNFLGNFLNWLREKTGENFPDLGATKSAEWCRNRYGSGDALLVGVSGDGGLAYVHGRWCGPRYVFIAFRFVVVFN